MPKNSKEQIEQDEKKLLSELMKNSKENINIIAKNFGFSGQKAWRMIKRLEKSQKIWGYSAVVDAGKQGLEKFMLFFKVEHKKPHPKDTIEIATTRMDPMKKDLGITILNSYCIHGEYDWVTIFTAKNIIQAKKFCDSLMKRFPDTHTTHISQILFTVREHCIQNPNITEMKDFI